MSNPSYQTRGNQLVIVNNDGSEVITALPSPIAQVLMHKHVIVVRTEPAPGVINNENIYGLTTAGALIWTVPSHIHLYDDSPYVNMVLVNDELKLINWDGLILFLNPYDGKMLREEWSK